MNHKTQIILHRVNTIDKLAQVPQGYGVEIDIRGYGERMLLSHDPTTESVDKYVDLEVYLKTLKEQGNVTYVIFNMKEAGFEKRVIDLADKYGISKSQYFLLDVEFPYLYRATRTENIRSIAVRYSEAEPIEAAEAQIIEGKSLLDWVWIDTNTTLPLNEDIVRRLLPFKTCLVSPDRWGRPEDIVVYYKQIKDLGMKLDAVMTGAEHAHEWEDLLNS